MQPVSVIINGKTHSSTYNCRGETLIAQSAIFEVQLMSAFDEAQCTDE